MNCLYICATYVKNGFSYLKLEKKCTLSIGDSAHSIYKFSIFINASELKIYDTINKLFKKSNKFKITHIILDDVFLSLPNIIKLINEYNIELIDGRAMYPHIVPHILLKISKERNISLINTTINIACSNKFDILQIIDYISAYIKECVLIGDELMLRTAHEIFTTYGLAVRISSTVQEGIFFKLDDIACLIDRSVTIVDLKNDDILLNLGTIYIPFKEIFPIPTLSIAEAILTMSIPDSINTAISKINISLTKNREKNNARVGGM